MILTKLSHDTSDTDREELITCCSDQQCLPGQDIWGAVSGYPADYHIWVWERIRSWLENHFNPSGHNVWNLISYPRFPIFIACDCKTLGQRGSWNVLPIVFYKMSLLLLYCIHMTLSESYLARASLSSFWAREPGNSPSQYFSTWTRISVSQNMDRSNSFPASSQLLQLVTSMILQGYQIRNSATQPCLLR